ncbi:DUF5665 domain-containing protein [Paenibacillus eucommiae]|uniref:Signal transduction histidine kinase n=1 Tax=Paenibacillus eucommiae TaxID=1355755 RepID=A0ABS4IYW5_9BACL|nr:DUF5665 domain-containing protein [Paenibacillus eucommiae]MBP1992777.1 hypothetical protein [Paenibacillus eucommiae]
MTDTNSSKESSENDHKLLKIINDKVSHIAAHMERTQIADYVQLLNHPRRLIWLNLLSGISRGVGIALGFTVFATTIVYVLQFVGALNLPIIGDYIAEIVKQVQFQLQRDGFY